MFKSSEYAWNDVNVVLLGRPVVGIRGIEYTVSQKKDNLYGKGKKPVSRTRGNKEYEGVITLLQSELEALQVAAGVGKDILDIPPFDVIIAYAPEDGGIVTTDIAKNVEFTQVKKGMKQGDPNMEIELPVILGDIQYNV